LIFCHSQPIYQKNLKDSDDGLGMSVDVFSSKIRGFFMPRKRAYVDTSCLYVHGSTGKIALKKAAFKFGSLLQVAKKLSCSNAHVYRMYNLECRMKLKWYNDIKKLLDQ
jgi:hypothetical protein